MFGFGFLAGGGEDDRAVVALDALEEVAHYRERLHPREVFVLEKGGAVFVEVAPELFDLGRGEKFRQVFIGAFADLAAQLLEVIFCQIGERQCPRRPRAVRWNRLGCRRDRR